MRRGQLRSPIIWFGGKGIMANTLLDLLPDHEIYVEVFGGGASLMFAKVPKPVEVYNDLDSGLVNFFRVLRDPESFQKLYAKASLTPYSREEWNFYKEWWDEPEDAVEKAYRWYVVARMSFSGRFGTSWQHVVTYSQKGMSCAVMKWLASIEALPQIHQRLMRVQIEHQDFRTILDRYDTSNTLFYLDPPYMKETRRAGEYDHEITASDHEDLVRILLEIKGKACLSGYAHPVYLPLENAGWRRLDMETSCFAAGRTRATGIQGVGACTANQRRTESVWLSPSRSQKTLFD